MKTSVTQSIRGTAGRTAVTAVAPVVWGTTYVVTTEVLPPGHPVFAALMRTLPAGLVALALARTLPGGIWWVRAAVLGILNIGAFNALLFVAAERLPGGVAGTLVAGQPLLVVGLAAVVLQQRPDAWRVGWGVAGVVGVGLVVLGPAAALDGAGVAAGVGCAVAMALGVTLTKRWGRPPEATPVAFAGWQLTAAGLFLLPLTLVIEGPPPAIGLAAGAGYLWLGLAGGLIAYIVWFQGIVTLPVTSVSLLGLLSPLVAALLGAALLGQLLGPVQIVGFVLTLAAVAAGQVPPPARLRPASSLAA
ncbi:MAG TPA: EamA family transporter [Nocardia sp.]|uniref:EamA family transporter n=1 Tax=Nocardia sp. TaxID=1821 RepID=UPI002B4AF345|nr:EamA family transporter [Nocardia sp.]HLS78192.1 EamA family transporter [Nocardia sp.]